MGADFTWSRSSEFLTDLIDKLPLLKARHRPTSTSVPRLPT